MNPQDAALGPRKDEGTLKVLVGSIQDGIPQRRSFRLQVVKNLIIFLTSIQRTELFSQMAPHCNLHQDLTVSVFPIYIVFPVTSGGDCYVFFWCGFSGLRSDLAFDVTLSAQNIMVTAGSLDLPQRSAICATARTDALIEAKHTGSHPVDAPAT